MAGRTTVMTLILGAFLFAASEQGTASFFSLASTVKAKEYSKFGLHPYETDLHHCTPRDVDHCYDLYVNFLWNPEFNPNPWGKFNEQAFNKACSEVKEKAPCHLQLANCSDEVRSGLRHREKGYEAVRDIVCEGTPLKDFATAFLCMNPEKFGRCMEQHLPPVQPGEQRLFLIYPFCEEYQGDIECYEPAFESSCQISLERAKAAFIRAYDAMALLRGCKESPNSAGAFLQLEFALGVLALLVLLQRFTSW